ncbi:MAG: hypothetical protein L0Z62_43830 [Gemmataceae bacterium]|nr:hypothetical protein [Gemmataceae bacterium]
MRRASYGRAAVLLGVVPLLLAGASVPAQDDFGKAVNTAIDRGVAALRKMQPGEFQAGPATPQQVGASALIGLTLLECGVAPDDADVKKAAQFVRKGCADLKYVYSLSLAVLFLDRLGDPQDVPLIEALAVRLLAAQDRKQGAWSYYSPDPSADEVRRLTEVVQKHKDGQAKHVAPRDRKVRPWKEVPQEVRDEITRIARGPGHTATMEVDNSNTQFALLALWVARRHGIPCDDAIARVERRLRATQRPHGGWTYRYPPFVPDQGVFRSPDYQPSGAMTCAGLLGMALAHAVTLDNPKAVKKNLAADPNVKAGFLALGAVIGDATGDGKQARLDKPGRLYYFLWSLERMAVAYGLKTIGGKDWYRWGAEILLANQGGDGSWNGEYSAGGCDTCFALLFLKRSNVAEDLSKRLRDRARDPGKATPKLQEMIDREFAPSPHRSPPGKGGK